MSDDDMMRTIVPKSDQLNADDLVGGHTVTITINRADVKESGEQKVTLGYEGDNGKPYKPGKAMCHVLIGLYGKSSKNYVGKSLTLYRDEKVKFGPDTVGGIRISHASHITEPRTIIIPVSKGIRKPFTVKPLVVEAAPDAEVIKALQLRASEAAAKGSASLDEFLKALPKEEKKHLVHFGKEIRAQAVEADAHLTTQTE